MLGKPSGGADLKLGLATAPALFAAQQFPELTELIGRRFSEEGDVERVEHPIHSHPLLWVMFEIMN